jgi:hypothetical protein
VWDEVKENRGVAAAESCGNLGGICGSLSFAKPFILTAPSSARAMIAALV